MISLINPLISPFKQDNQLFTGPYFPKSDFLEYLWDLFTRSKRQFKLQEIVMSLSILNHQRVDLTDYLII